MRALPDFRSPRWAALTALLTTSVLLTACGSGTGGSGAGDGKPRSGGTLTFAVGSDMRLCGSPAGRQQRHHLLGAPGRGLPDGPGPQDRQDRAVAGEELGHQCRRDRLHLPPALGCHLQRRVPADRPGGQGQLRRGAPSRCPGNPGRGLPERRQEHHGGRPAHRQGHLRTAQRPVPAGDFDTFPGDRVVGEREEVTAAEVQRRGHRIRTLRTQAVRTEPVGHPGQAPRLRLGLLTVEQEGRGVPGQARVQGRAGSGRARRQSPLRPGGRDRQCGPGRRGGAQGRPGHPPEAGQPRHRLRARLQQRAAPPEGRQGPPGDPGRRRPQADRRHRLPHRHPGSDQRPRTHHARLHQPRPGSRLRRGQGEVPAGRSRLEGGRRRHAHQGRQEAEPDHRLGSQRGHEPTRVGVDTAATEGCGGSGDPQAAPAHPADTDTAVGRIRRDMGEHHPRRPRHPAQLLLHEAGQLLPRAG